jgi:hypothetical protein
VQHPKVKELKSSVCETMAKHTQSACRFRLGRKKRNKKRTHQKAKCNSVLGGGGEMSVVGGNPRCKWEKRDSDTRPGLGVWGWMDGGGQASLWRWRAVEPATLSTSECGWAVVSF